MKNKMQTQIDLKRAWNEITTIQSIKDRVVLKSGKPLHNTFFNVLSLIAHQDGTTIQGLTHHPHFLETSLSTIKRAVNCLLEENLITSTQNSQDKRENLLSIVEK